MKIRLAISKDLPSLYSLGHAERSDIISRAVEEKRAWLVELKESRIVGYGTIMHQFFGRSFIDMVYIEEQYRSKGFGPALIRCLEQTSRSDNVFTSTNESNLHMQHVLIAMGYERSGTIFNLDEGDPELVFVKKAAST
jgi:ribosomal protein S18 acetylase RimI-like enzyme